MKCIDCAYFVIDPSRRLVERERSFRVKKIVPLEGLAADAELMPEFPGLTDAENCRDWETGVPVDLEEIRDKDEVYWDEHRSASAVRHRLRDGRDQR